MAGPRDDQEDGDPGFDTSVDILVGLVAIILLATILILPFVNFSKNRVAALKSVNDDIRAEQNFQHRGQPVLKLIARQSGLIFFENETQYEADLDTLLTDKALQDRLSDAHGANVHPLLFIENDGQEAAFLVETLLANQGFLAISRVYLDPSCSFFQPKSRPAACALGGRQK